MSSPETNQRSVTLWSQEDEPSVSATCTMDGNEFGIFLGPKPDLLPFELHLNDFVLERYPGSNSPSGYRSNVTLIDNAENVENAFQHLHE
ncbi:MAG: cytochrome c biogenesis protein ResB [Marinilabiliales bacterium]|nr:cytochrome c biogenesis protein ResB [Marinilabiliales bacterium]